MPSRLDSHRGISMGAENLVYWRTSSTWWFRVSRVGTLMLDRRLDTSASLSSILPHGRKREAVIGQTPTSKEGTSHDGRA